MAPSILPRPRMPPRAPQPRSDPGGANVDPRGTGRGGRVLPGRQLPRVVERGADVLEQLANDRAQEDQGDDHDDGDEGEQQTVLDERLAFLIILAVEPRKKSADELKHVGRDLLS